MILFLAVGKNRKEARAKPTERSGAESADGVRKSGRLSQDLVRYFFEPIGKENISQGVQPLQGGVA